MGKTRLGLDGAQASHDPVGPDRCATAVTARTVVTAGTAVTADTAVMAGTSVTVATSRAASSRSGGVRVDWPGVPVRRRSQDV